MKKFLVADLLCGAGGSSTGAMRALRDIGYDMELVCLNHWQTAIDTHQKNHPKARHYVQDIATVEPYKIVPELYLDLLMASPSCVHHSNARGGRPTSDQQRSDPWHIITWLSQLRVKRMIIENVWEFCLQQDTTVLTKTGLIPIKDIKVGDEVWTHKSRWRKVTNTIKRQKIVHRLNGDEHSITEATLNHKYYAKKRFAPKVQGLTPNIYLNNQSKLGNLQNGLVSTTPIKLSSNNVFDAPSWVKTDEFDWHYWASPTNLPVETVNLPESLVKLTGDKNVDQDLLSRFFYTVGRMLAAGGMEVTDDKNSFYSLINDYRGDESDLQDIGKNFIGTWDVKAHTPFYNVFKMTGQEGEDLAHWIMDYFSDDKMIRQMPNFLYSLPDYCKIAFWNGYIRHNDLNTIPDAFVIDFYSREFAVGMKLMLQTLGSAAELHIRPKDQKSVLESPIIAGMVAPEPKIKEPVEKPTVYVLQKSREKYDAHYDENFRWSVVYNVYEEAIQKTVYDITVEEDHSFIADGMVTHNCNWGPIDPKSGRPIVERKGEYFQAWIKTIQAMGFEPEWQKLNAADYGEATTRERFILMARSDGRKLNWPTKTHINPKDADKPEFKGMPLWRGAETVIDWKLKGKSIFNRAKPLVENTMKRIYTGALRENWPEPFLVILRNNMASRGIDIPMPTIAASGLHIAIAQPVIVNMKGKSTATSLKQPLPTQTSHAYHLYKAEPIVLSTHSSGTARSTKLPLPTISTGGAGNDKRPGCARPAVVQAVQRQSEEPFVLSQASGGQSRPTRAPMPTITGGGNGARHSLLVPVTHSKSNIAPRPTTRPMPTITTAKGGEHALAEAKEYFTDQNGVEYDILFRMLEPEELASAMGLNDGDDKYIFTGTKTQKVKQIGNAVSVRKMKACVKALLMDEALEKEDLSKEKAAA